MYETPTHQQYHYGHFQQQQGQHHPDALNVAGNASWWGAPGAQQQSQHSNHPDQRQQQEQHQYMQYQPAVTQAPIFNQFGGHYYQQQTMPHPQQHHQQQHRHGGRQQHHHSEGGAQQQQRGGYPPGMMGAAQQHNNPSVAYSFAPLQQQQFPAHQFTMSPAPPHGGFSTAPHASQYFTAPQHTHHNNHHQNDRGRTHTNSKGGISANNGGTVIGTASKYPNNNSGLNNATFEVYDPDYSHVTFVPSNKIYHKPPNAKRLSLCRRFHCDVPVNEAIMNDVNQNGGGGDGQGGRKTPPAEGEVESEVLTPGVCSRGSRCRYVHADLAGCKRQQIHVSYVWSSPEECTLYDLVIPMIEADVDHWVHRVAQKLEAEQSAVDRADLLPTSASDTNKEDGFVFTDPELEEAITRDLCVYLRALRFPIMAPNNRPPTTEVKAVNMLHTDGVSHIFPALRRVLETRARGLFLVAQHKKTVTGKAYAHEKEGQIVTENGDHTIEEAQHPQYIAKTGPDAGPVDGTDVSPAAAGATVELEVLLSHCAHYYFNRICHRGERCHFVHSLFISERPSRRSASGDKSSTAIVASENDDATKKGSGAAANKGVKRLVRAPLPPVVESNAKLTERKYRAAMEQLAKEREGRSHGTLTHQQHVRVEERVRRLKPTMQEQHQHLPMHQPQQQYGGGYTDFQSMPPHPPSPTTVGNSVGGAVIMQQYYHQPTSQQFVGQEDSALHASAFADSADNSTSVSPQNTNLLGVSRGGSLSSSAMASMTAMAGITSAATPLQGTPPLVPGGNQYNNAFVDPLTLMNADRKQRQGSAPSSPATTPSNTPANASRFPVNPRRSTLPTMFTMVPPSSALANSPKSFAGGSTAAHPGSPHQPSITNRADAAAISSLGVGATLSLSQSDNALEAPPSAQRQAGGEGGPLWNVISPGDSNADTYEETTIRVMDPDTKTVDTNPLSSEMVVVSPSHKFIATSSSSVVGGSVNAHQQMARPMLPPSYLDVNDHGEDSEYYTFSMYPSDSAAVGYARDNACSDGSSGGSSLSGSIHAIGTVTAQPPYIAGQIATTTGRIKRASPSAPSQMQQQRSALGAATVSLSKSLDNPLALQGMQLSGSQMAAAAGASNSMVANFGGSCSSDVIKGNMHGDGDPRLSSLSESNNDRLFRIHTIQQQHHQPLVGSNSNNSRSGISSQNNSYAASISSNVQGGQQTPRGSMLHHTHPNGMQTLSSPQLMGHWSTSAAVGGPQHMSLSGTPPMAYYDPRNGSTASAPQYAPQHVNRTFSPFSNQFGAQNSGEQADTAIYGLPPQYSNNTGSQPPFYQQQQQPQYSNQPEYLTADQQHKFFLDLLSSEQNSKKPGGGTANTSSASPPPASGSNSHNSTNTANMYKYTNATPVNMGLHSGSSSAFQSYGGTPPIAPVGGAEVAQPLRLPVMLSQGWHSAPGGGARGGSSSQ